MAARKRKPRTARCTDVDPAALRRCVLKLIESGRAHSEPVWRLTAEERKSAEWLCSLGWARRMPARGSFPARYVVTAIGSHKLGTFASDDENFLAVSRHVGASVALARRAALAQGRVTLTRRTVGP